MSIFLLILSGAFDNIIKKLEVNIGGDTLINAEKSVLLQETEVKPNKYAQLVLSVLLCGMLFCWIINEIGLFRVDKWQMRIGSAIPMLCVCILIILMKRVKNMMSRPITKWLVYIVSTILTLFISTLLTFHTTIMLLFPVFMAMLYRSRGFGIASMISAVSCTILTPIIGYLLKTWDIPLFEELLLIGTNCKEVIEVGATYETTFISVAKIILYLVLPRVIMVGSCSVLMFYVIKLGKEHVENQITIDGISKRDFLTGFYNQNYYKQIVHTKNESQTIGVIFYDVNGLKAINDQYGHELGDLLLKRSAESLLPLIDGETKHAFRIGGDEFLIIIEDANEKKVNDFIDEWKINITNINNENVEKYEGLKCSMAYGYQIGNISDLESLVSKADTLMYENKAIMKALKL